MNHSSRAFNLPALLSRALALLLASALAVPTTLASLDGSQDTMRVQAGLESSAESNLHSALTAGLEEFPLMEKVRDLLSGKDAASDFLTSREAMTLTQIKRSLDNYLMVNPSGSTQWRSTLPEPSIRRIETVIQDAQARAERFRKGERTPEVLPRLARMIVSYNGYKGIKLHPVIQETHLREFIRNHPSAGRPWSLSREDRKKLREKFQPMVSSLPGKRNAASVPAHSDKAFERAFDAIQETVHHLPRQKNQQGKIAAGLEETYTERVRRLVASNYSEAIRSARERAEGEKKENYWGRHGPPRRVDYDVTVYISGYGGKLPIGYPVPSRPDYRTALVKGARGEWWIHLHLSESEGLLFRIVLSWNGQRIKALKDPRAEPPANQRRNPEDLEGFVPLKRLVGRKDIRWLKREAWRTVSETRDVLEGGIRRNKPIFALAEAVTPGSEGVFQMVPIRGRRYEVSRWDPPGLYYTSLQGQRYRRLDLDSAGLEERQGVQATLMERWDGIRSAAERLGVVVIGQSVVGRFSGLEELTRLDRHFLVDRGDGTVIHLIELAGLEEIGSVSYYGGLEEAQRFSALTTAARFPEDFVRHHPPTGISFLAGLEEILRLAGIPEEVISANLEEFAAGLEELAPAA